MKCQKKDRERHKSDCIYSLSYKPVIGHENFTFSMCPRCHVREREPGCKNCERCDIELKPEKYKGCLFCRRAIEILLHLSNSVCITCEGKFKAWIMTKEDFKFNIDIVDACELVYASLDMITPVVCIISCYEYMENWCGFYAGNEKWFLPPNFIDLSNIPKEHYSKEIIRQLKVNGIYLNDKIQYKPWTIWKVHRLFWIGKMKNSSIDCIIARLPIEIIRFITYFLLPEDFKHK